MKNLVLAAVLGAAAASTACTTSNNLTVTAHWSFKHIADGTARSCPTGFDTATVFAQPVDNLTAEANGGLISADLFNCSDGAGTVVVPDGLYIMSVRIENHSGSMKYADSEGVFIDTATDASFSVEILDDGGYLTFRWGLRDKQTNAPLTCAEAGVTSNGSVESIATSTTNANFMLTDKFTCEDHYGTTDGLPAGTYVVSLDAENNNARLGDPVNFAATPVGAPNIVTDLGKVLLPID
ncbi:MAG TPA: hypothetical protein VIX73_16240 [Kofleriaceae bacterium]|jgi:hypothetical protein